MHSFYLAVWFLSFPINLLVFNFFFFFFVVVCLQCSGIEMVNVEIVNAFHFNKLFILLWREISATIGSTKKRKKKSYWVLSHSVFDQCYYVLHVVLFFFFMVVKFFVDWKIDTIYLLCARAVFCCQVKSIFEHNIFIAGLAIVEHEIL